MPKIVGGVAALVALAAGILGHVDPILCLERATLALLLGWFCGQVWYVLITLGGKVPNFEETTSVAPANTATAPAVLDGTEGN